MNQSGRSLESKAANDPSDPSALRIYAKLVGAFSVIVKTNGSFAALLKSKLIVIWLMATLEININLIPGGGEDETRASTGS